MENGVYNTKKIYVCKHKASKTSCIHSGIPGNKLRV